MATSTKDTLAEAVRIAKPWGFSDGSTANQGRFNWDGFFNQQS